MGIKRETNQNKLIIKRRRKFSIVTMTTATATSSITEVRYITIYGVGIQV